MNGLNYWEVYFVLDSHRLVEDRNVRPNLKLAVWVYTESRLIIEDSEYRRRLYDHLLTTLNNKIQFKNTFRMGEEKADENN